MKPNFKNNINKKIGVNGTFIIIYNNIEGASKVTIVDMISPNEINRVKYRDENNNSIPCECSTMIPNKHHITQFKETTPNFKQLFAQVEGKIDSSYNFFLDIGCIPTRF